MTKFREREKQKDYILLKYPLLIERQYFMKSIST